MDEHGGNIWRLARETGNNWYDIIDFSANINPLGFPAGVEEVLLRYLPAIHHYPDPYCLSLREKLARLHQVGSENILIGNGATELIYLIPLALRLNNALILAPSFIEYEKALSSFNKRPCFYILEEERDFQWDPEPIEEAAASLEAIFLANPASPTGVVIHQNKLLRLLERCQQRGTFLLVDEAFIEFLEEPEDHSLIPFIQGFDRLIILRSFTKIFGIPGLRLGYTVANSQIISLLQQAQCPWSVNLLAQVVGERLLEQQEFIRRTRELVNRERAFLFSQLRRFPQLKPYPSEVNFILIRLLDNRWKATELRERLFSYRLLIRDCSNFRGLDSSYFRIAVRTREDNLRLIEALQELLSDG